RAQSRTSRISGTANIKIKRRRRCPRVSEGTPRQGSKASDFYKRERSVCNLVNLQLRASQYGYACLVRWWVWIVDGFFRARLDSRAGRCCFDERKGFDA